MMEFLFYVGAFLVALFIYGVISVAIFDKFSRSSGISKIFWFLIMIGTLSFIFGNSDSSYSSSGYGGSSSDDDYDFFGSSDDDSSSCSWDSDNSSWDCDDD